MEAKGGSELLFTRKHLRLLNIARLSEIFAWIFVVISTFAVFGSITPYLDIARMRSTYSIIVMFAPAVANFVKNFAVFVAVLGISMGLRMIVETDVNYRLRKEAKSDEQQ